MLDTTKIEPRQCDLHTHSTYSDGQLSPQHLAQKLAQAGVKLWALTDHDTVTGNADAAIAARQHGIHFVPGVEISVTHQKKLLHVVGLAIDADHAGLVQGLASNQALRTERAQRIADKLENLGFPGALAGATRLAGSSLLTRNEFARWLVAEKVVKTLDEAFKRYLKQGKPAYVATQWMSLEKAVAMIHQAGGQAVLAHPMKYRLTNAWLTRIIGDFKAAGGDAVEVISGQTAPHDVRSIAELVRRHMLTASLGSDFHSEDQIWLKLGQMPPLPQSVTPVWHQFEIGE